MATSKYTVQHREHSFTAVVYKRVKREKNAVYLFLNKRTYFRMHVLLILVVVSSVLSSSSPEPDPDAAIVHYPSAPIDYCANGGICVPPVLCSLHYLETLYDPSAACSVAEGTPGLCCPPINKRPCKSSALFIVKSFYPQIRREDS